MTTSFRFDLARSKRRAAEIAANARSGRMPSPAEIIFLCELVRDLANIAGKQEDMIETANQTFEALVDATRPPVN